MIFQQLLRIKPFSDHFVKLKQQKQNTTTKCTLFKISTASYKHQYTQIWRKIKHHLSLTSLSHTFCHTFTIFLWKLWIVYGKSVYLVLYTLFFKDQCTFNTRVKLLLRRAYGIWDFFQDFFRIFMIFFVIFRDFMGFCFLGFLGIFPRRCMGFFSELFTPLFNRQTDI